jgi:Ca-activated chloride channel homolog
VSFQSPAFLLSLSLIPLAVWLYVTADRRRRRRSAAFAPAKLLPSVAPVRPGARRHLPAALYVAALTAVAVALARPEATVAVPEERAAVVVATDVSGSMQARDVEPSRMAAVRKAALELLDEAPGKLRIGAVAFNHAVRAIESPSMRRDDVRALFERMRPSGGTATGEGLSAALGLLERERGGAKRKSPGAVILLSDGKSTHGRDPIPEARRAARDHIPVYTVALGTQQGTIQVERADGTSVTRSVPPDAEAMRRIATISGGRTFAIDQAASLASVYERLGSQIATRNEKREITSAFVGGAAALLLLGGAMSLRWFGRLP